MRAMQNKYAALSRISSEDWFLSWSCFYESSESSSKPKKKKGFQGMEYLFCLMLEANPQTEPERATSLTLFSEDRVPLISY